MDDGACLYSASIIRFGRVCTCFPLFGGLTNKEVLLSAIALIGQYLLKLVWPMELCAFYVFDKSTGLLDMRVLAGLPKWNFAMRRFLVVVEARPTGFPSGLICDGDHSRTGPGTPNGWGLNVFTERYLYLPSGGLLLEFLHGYCRDYGPAPPAGKPPGVELSLPR